MANRTLLALAAVAAVVVAGLVLVNLGQRESASATVGDNPHVGDGDLTVFLFEDYQCPHCRDYSLSPAFGAFLERWVESGEVTLVFKHLAFVGPYSADAARASQCVHASNPGAWLGWDHDVYAVQAQGQAPTPTVLATIAREHGVDMDAYLACLEDADRLDGVVAGNAREFDRAGAGGTPAMLVAGRVLNPAADPGGVDAAIEEALADGDGGDGGGGDAGDGGGDAAQ